MGDVPYEVHSFTHARKAELRNYGILHQILGGPRYGRGALLISFAWPQTEKFSVVGTARMCELVGISSHAKFVRLLALHKKVPSFI